jgi:hypothetical protein
MSLSQLVQWQRNKRCEWVSVHSHYVSCQKFVELLPIWVWQPDHTRVAQEAATLSAMAAWQPLWLAVKQLLPIKKQSTGRFLPGAKLN